MVFLIVVILGSIMLAGQVGDIQRQWCGEKAGNILFIPEVCFLISMALAFHWWGQGKKAATIFLLILTVAGLLGFVGWFTQPGPTYYRAFDRLSEIEGDLVNYSTYPPLNYTYDDKPPSREEVARTVGYLRRELAIRKLEYSAAQVRYERERGKPVTGWWIVSGVFLTSGVILAFDKRLRREMNPNSL